MSESCSSHSEREGAVAAVGLGWFTRFLKCFIYFCWWVFEGWEHLYCCLAVFFSEGKDDGVIKRKNRHKQGCLAASVWAQRKNILTKTAHVEPQKHRNALKKAPA